MTDDNSPTTSASDVVIVGAGPAGLSLACALADSGLSACLLEQQPLEALEAPADDGREIALTHRSRGLMQGLGLWERLPADAATPLREARVLDGTSAQALRFAASGPTKDPLGWLVPNHAIRSAALASARLRPNIRLQCGARVVGLQLDPGRAVVTLADGRRHGAALVVAADSRFSQTRRLAGIGATMRDFGRSVIAATVSHAQPNDGIAWECFRYGNTLALLPMSGDRSSAVVTLPSDAVPEWLALSDEAFAARIETQSEGRLGAIGQVGARHHYPLVSAYAQRFVARRFALVGDAAVGMHPVTAHGFNFGLYGVETLVDEIVTALRAGRDIGDATALESFERRHRLATWPTYAGTNALVSLFTDDRAPARSLRRAVLDIAGRLPPFDTLVQFLIVRQLTGDGAASHRRRTAMTRRTLHSFIAKSERPRWPN
jgi:ubiquinone biosynthesis UbiH/UbiF/VisC/COQ6 family hydroxylase